MLGGRLVGVGDPRVPVAPAAGERGPIGRDVVEVDGVVGEARGDGA